MVRLHTGIYNCQFDDKFDMSHELNTLMFRLSQFEAQQKSTVLSINVALLQMC